jgi:hypothetical protein
MSNPEADPKDIEFVANRLVVGGQQLRAREFRGRASGERRMDAEELDERIRLGRFAILRVMEEGRQRAEERNTGPDVVITPWPPVQVMRLSSAAQQPSVVREVGRGIGDDERDVYERFRPYWRAVGDNGFTPRVHMLAGGPESREEGPWLVARKPEFDDVAEKLGFRGTEYLRNMRSGFVAAEMSGGELPLVRAWLDAYRREAGEIVDAMPDDYESRARAQICMILSCAERRRNLGDTDGFMEEVEDALLYAQNLDNPALVRTIQNGSWQLS